MEIDYCDPLIGRWLFKDCVPRDICGSPEGLTSTRRGRKEGLGLPGRGSSSSRIPERGGLRDCENQMKSQGLVEENC